MSGNIISIEEYKKYAKVITFSCNHHVCDSFLFNRHYKVKGLRVLPDKQKLGGKTKEEAIHKAYYQYVLICLYLIKNDVSLPQLFATKRSRKGRLI